MRDFIPNVVAASSTFDQDLFVAIAIKEWCNRQRKIEAFPWKGFRDVGQVVVSFGVPAWRNVAGGESKRRRECFGLQAQK